MICKYRVTLEGIKGFYRLYEVNDSCSLYRFHKQLRSDLEFPMDQPILFKAFDPEGNVAARYALIDLGYKAVDEVTIADTIKAGVTRFMYFYDIASKKYVIITLEGQGSGPAATPTVVESKGPIPLEFENGYVAFEDLPEQRKVPRPAPFEESDDDEDEDEDDEDDDDDEDEEKEEIIFDENE